MAVEHKVCSVCGLVKPPTEFFYRPNGQPLSPKCKRCYNEHHLASINSDAAHFFGRRLTIIKTRAKKAGYTTDIEVQDLLDLWAKQRAMCVLTGVPMKAHIGTDLSASIDRISCNKGYLKANIRLVCARANMMRGVMEDHELIWWARAMVEHVGY